VSHSERKWEDGEVKRAGGGDKVGEMERESKRVMEGGRVGGGDRELRWEGM